jgi:flagellar hook-associated protein 3 FlgL
VDIGLAAVTLKSAQQRQTDTKAQLENVLSGVEDASPEAVAAQLLTLQTQMQASYQTTAMMAKMSLVNYLG